MLVISGFGLLAILYLASGSVQTPRLIKCPGTDDSVVKIQNITIENAVLGRRLLFSASVLVKKTSGSRPVLNIFVASSEGMPLSCVYSVVPKQLKLCGGETTTELLLNLEWNNYCPVSPGQYTARLLFNLPDGITARSCIGDGKLFVTLVIQDEGYIFSCVSFPLTVDLK